METYRGLVLAERSVAGKGKFIDILTEHNTVQEVFVRGGSRAASQTLSTTQQFAYATFSVRTRGDRHTLDSAVPIRLFYHLRDTLPRMSLAIYCCELVRNTIQEYQVPDETCEAFRLVMNALHYLEQDKCAPGLLKPIFELRLMTELGMMPDLLVCRRCGAFLPERLYFDVENGCYYCASCITPTPQQQLEPLGVSALRAMRHIVFADFTRLFFFRLGEDSLRALSRCTERFIQYHLTCAPKSLHFYYYTQTLLATKPAPTPESPTPPPNWRETAADPPPNDL